MQDDTLLKKDDLIKSLRDLDFTEEEVNEIVEKAEKEGKLETDDKEVVDKPNEYEEKEEDEMKKAYDKVMTAKADFDKSMGEFLDKFGKMPAFEKPKGVEKAEDIKIEKSEENGIEKSELLDIEKAFGDRFDTIMKGFETQSKFNEDISKSIKDIHDTVEAIANTPNPFKGLFGNYKSSLLEKGYIQNDEGQNVYNLANKNAVISAFEKSLDKIENEKDKQIVRDMISSYTISGITSDIGLDIVKKALNIDFEK